MAKPNALGLQALFAAAVLLVSACNSTEVAREQPSPRSVVHLVLPEAIRDSDPYVLQVHLGASLAAFNPVEYTLQNGSVALRTTTQVGSGRQARTDTAGGLRIIEYRLPAAVPNAADGPGFIRYTVEFDAGDLLNKAGEPEQPAIFALRRAAVAARKAAGTVVLVELSYLGGGRFLAVAAVR